MDNQALGLIETIGMTGAIEAADTCLKSANVQLIGYELSTGGLVTVKVQGSVGAVKSSIDAAKTSASKVSKVVSTLIIPRPAKGIACIIDSKTNTKSVEVKPEKEREAIPKNKDDKEVHKTDEEKSNNILNVKEVKQEDDQRIDKTEENISKVDESVSGNYSQKNEIEKEIVTDSSENSKKKIENKSDDKKIEKKSKNDICNLCGDPLCPRKKGQPRNWCINGKNR